MNPFDMRNLRSKMVDAGYEAHNLAVSVYDWIVDWAKQGTMHSMTVDGEIYHWVQYTYAMEYHAIKSRFKIKRAFDKLVFDTYQIDGVSHTMFKRYVARNTSGTFVYYHIDPVTYKYLTGKEFTMEVQPLVEPEKESIMEKRMPPSVSKKKREKTSSTISERSTELIHDIMSKYMRKDNQSETDYLFMKQRLPQVGKPATNVMKNFDKYVKYLYDGTFLTKCHMRDDVLPRIDETSFEEMKGDWGVISAALESSCKKALKSRKQRKSRSDSDTDKALSIDTFLYSPVFESSNFLLNLSQDYSMRGCAGRTIRDSWFKTHDPHSVKYIDSFLSHRSGVNPYIAYRSLKNVSEYLLSNWESMRSYQKEEWDHEIRGTKTIFSAYCDYLSFVSNVNPNWMDVKHSYWEKFVDKFYDETGIALVPREMDQKAAQGY
jgi:hypothetical protein